MFRDFFLAIELGQMMPRIKVKDRTVPLRKKGAQGFWKGLESECQGFVRENRRYVFMGNSILQIAQWPSCILLPAI
jgi:hypothetical protein